MDFSETVSDFDLKLVVVDYDCRYLLTSKLSSPPLGLYTYIKQKLMYKIPFQIDTFEICTIGHRDKRSH